MENQNESILDTYIPQILVLIGSLSLIYYSIFMIEPSSFEGTIFGLIGLICFGIMLRMIVYQYNNKLLNQGE